MTARVLSVATGLPPHVVTADATRAELRRALEASQAARYVNMVDASGVETRASVLPVEELFRVTDLGARTEEYVRHAVALGEDVARRALARAGVAAADVDLIVSCSCTGHMMPALEARLTPRLGAPAVARRLPLTELGCSAGAASLGLAGDLLAAGRARTALVVAVELCSLCLQTTEPRITDIVGALLFGDGAAAAVVRADGADAGLEILGSRSVLWPDSLEALGMRLGPTGLRLGLSPALPRLVREQIRPTVDAFLADAGVPRDAVRFLAVHPGGPKILEAVGEGLGLAEGALCPTWDVWRRCGNMSSVTLFFVLREIMDTTPPAPGDLGLALAFGPGVACELLLLRAGRGPLR
jgi:alkylresorcinol/alkylpyrone synthase